MPGSDNVVSDTGTLSFPAAAVVPVQGGQVSLSELAEAQLCYSETQQYLGRPGVLTGADSGRELYVNQTGALRPIVLVPL